MDHIERALAIRAAYKIHETRAMMKKSAAKQKTQESEIFAIEINQLVRMHLIYLGFKMSRERLNSRTIIDPKVKTYLEYGVKIFALKQL